MSFSILLFISFCFFPILLAEDIPSKIDRAQFEDYVKDFVEAKVRENVAAGDLVRQKKLEALQARLNQAESRIKDLELQESKTDDISQNKHNTLLASKRFVMNAGYPVGFIACTGGTYLMNFRDKHIIIFERVFTNTGRAYHNYTGGFMAPFKGLYAFHFSAMTSPGKEQYLSLVQDGVVLSVENAITGLTNTYHTDGNQWVIELNQGSSVRIQTYLPGEIHGKCFSGFMISEME